LKEKQWFFAFQYLKFYDPTHDNVVVAAVMYRLDLTINIGN
jgi:hypothetical protein